LAKHGGPFDENPGFRAELAKFVPCIKKGGPEDIHRDPATSMKKSKNADNLKEEEGENFLKMSSLQELDDSLAPEDKLEDDVSAWPMAALADLA
jgi:hypothetical protein